MKKNTLMASILLAIILMMIMPAVGVCYVPPEGESGYLLIGTYNVNYRYNAAGGPPNYNPWYANYIPPGPYFLDPTLTPPGTYKAVIKSWGPQGGGNAAIWDGTSEGGNRYPIDQYVGYTEEFGTHQWSNSNLRG